MSSQRPEESSPETETDENENENDEQEEASDTEPGEEDSDDDEEDLDAELEALLSFAQMDSEAAVAYDVAAESLAEPRIVEILRSFAEDHRRHVNDIREVVTALGGDLGIASPDPAESTFASMAETVTQLGPDAGLRTLIASEEFTNSSYETAIELITEPDALAVLERNYRDEQRHLQTLLQELEREERAEERVTA